MDFWVNVIWGDEKNIRMNFSRQIALLEKK